MNDDYYQSYGKLAETNVTATERAGRYAVQAAAERLIVPDLMRKLDIKPDSKLLDIGCNSGTLTIPLSFMSGHTVGLDHPQLIEICLKKCQDPRITWIEGAFPTDNIGEPFDRILIYSVVHCLPELASVEAFIDRAVDLLAPQGRLLIGDMPSEGKKARFQASETGRRFQIEWEKAVAETSDENADTVREVLGKSKGISAFTDDELSNLQVRYRRKGFDAYLLPQPAELPFGYTREDLMIIRP